MHSNWRGQIYKYWMTQLASSVQTSPMRASDQQGQLHGHQEPFFIKLTARQAAYLNSLLPLNYSLHPQRKKRGPSAAKKMPKTTARTNLPPRQRTPPSANSTNRPPPSPRTPQSIPKPPPSHEDCTLPSELNEQTASMQDFCHFQRKVEAKRSAEWRLQFLAECKTVPLFVQAYGRVLDQLEQRTRNAEISQEDFMNTVVQVFSDKKMRSSKRGLELSEQLKSVFLKHSNPSSAIKKTELSLPEKPEQESRMPTPKLQAQPKQAVPREKERRSEPESFSSQALETTPSHYQPAPTGNERGFVEAAFVSRNLRRVPPTQALLVLSRYGIQAVDVLKIHALGMSDLRSLKLEVRGLKKRFPHCISDSEGEGSQESSFSLSES